MSEMRNGLTQPDPSPDMQGPAPGQLSESNPLVPGSHAGSESGIEHPSQPGQTPWDIIYNSFLHNKAVYEKVRTASQQVMHLRSGLDKLLQLGDMVTPEDVMDEAGKVVARGIAPQDMASLLSTMPTLGGQQLQGWLAIHDATLRDHEAQLQSAVDLARHRTSVSALHAMAAHAVQVPGAPKGGGFGPRTRGGFGAQPTVRGGFGPNIEPPLGARPVAGFGGGPGPAPGFGANALTGVR